ncbi:MAG: 50S ribosomal protein L18 [Phaeodactylibacter sp.]|uniref:50S ribosomal protein L18 n=1 Tax=Phaeodactylibacter sp. TaxID=1940289 RepID=UPI0032F043C2
MQFSKRNRRKRIHWRIRNKVTGTAERPRLNIYRSNKYIYAQLVDDIQGHTLASASSREESVSKEVKKSEQSKEVGKLLAERAKAVNVERAVFDRGGYLYHGRVKALAEGAREGGLHL